MRLTAFAAGAAAFVVLLALYFLLVGLVSGREYAIEQFSTYWYFLVSLAAGFGIQMGLYAYLKRLVAHPGATRCSPAARTTWPTSCRFSAQRGW